MDWKAASQGLAAKLRGAARAWWRGPYKAARPECERDESHHREVFLAPFSLCFVHVSGYLWKFGFLFVGDERDVQWLQKFRSSGRRACASSWSQRRLTFGLSS